MQHQLPALGTAMEGGFFGGIINVAGLHKGVIWAPKKEGYFRSILLAAGKTVAGAGSPFDCHANTQALLAAGSPAAERVTTLNIGGFNDWLIPSRDVLELGYRHFKPTTHRNYCSWRDGENPNSIPSGWLYTSDSPIQTHQDVFKDDGEEAFEPGWYWSSTALPNGDTAFDHYFLNGIQGLNDLSAECRVRAVRLIQL
ncbi:DUF1566 domain-containing protein [Pseudomonas sp.]|uniref:DUF1566 domain-containing protein n=1 Tax=Pseudomonas sp. TaxID=306 RepID=UPI003F3B88A2